MRKILFRGISRDTQTFVFGDLLQWKDGDCDICVNDLDTNEKTKFPVYPKTVGQFTGLTEKSGKKIFEGDIVTCQTKYGRDIGEVVIEAGRACVRWDSKYRYPECGKITMFYYINARTKIIGNIHENPELLKEGAQV